MRGARRPATTRSLTTMSRRFTTRLIAASIAALALAPAAAHATTTPAALATSVTNATTYVKGLQDPTTGAFVSAGLSNEWAFSALAPATSPPSTSCRRPEQRREQERAQGLSRLPVSRLVAGRLPAGDRLRARDAQRLLGGHRPGARIDRAEPDREDRVLLAARVAGLLGARSATSTARSSRCWRSLGPRRQRAHSACRRRC